MVPFIEVPNMIAKGMSAYRDVLCREAGFEHVSRYLSGLLLRENKTLQEIHAQQVYLEGEGSSRRAMHAGVFEAGWDSAALMRQHRAIVGQTHQDSGREMISLDWTLSHHEDGFEIDGTKRSYDYVNHCMSRFQTVVTTSTAIPSTSMGLQSRCRTRTFVRPSKAI